MRKMVIRALSLILCLILLCGALPSGVFTARAALVTPYKCGDTVTLGTYPQTKVEDPALIAALNKVKAEWKPWAWSVGDGTPGSMTRQTYAYYKDISFGGASYRGVKFAQYRPAYVYEGFPDAENAYQKRMGYETDVAYWFKYEPIEWIVLDPGAGLLVARKVLDAQPFTDTYYEEDKEIRTEIGDGWYSISHEYTAFSDEAHTRAANDYAFSYVRKWLNNGFYALALNNKPQAAYIVPQQIVADDAADKVFLLSAEEAESEAYAKKDDWGYSRNVLSDAYASDYALALGLENYGYNDPYWLLRSPGGQSTDVAVFSWSVGDRGAGEVCGVRPAMAVNFGECVSGDVDGDGTVTASDARCTLRLAVKLAYASDTSALYADADGNGSVTAADARLILRRAVQLEDGESFSRFFKPAAYVPQQDEIYYRNKVFMERLTIAEGEKVTLTERHIIRKGETAAWSSSNKAAATVSAQGEVKGIKKGFACVCLSCGGAQYYYYINVLSPLQQRIYALQNKYPDGYYWNANPKSKKYPAVSEIPCTDHASGQYSKCIGQCAGFAYLMSNEVFPNAPTYKVSRAQDIKIGDYIRCLPHHSVFVIDRVNKGEPIDYDMYSDENVTAWSDIITIVECNWDCRCGISWGRTIDLESLSFDPAYSFSRYK